MRMLSLVAALLLASPAFAQGAAQQELNELTGVPAGTRCFQAFPLAQEMTKHYVASGECPNDLTAMDPADFMKALKASGAIDQDFVSDACQVQMKLMFRAGREWIAADPDRRCTLSAAEMRQRPFFKDYVR